MSRWWSHRIVRAVTLMTVLAAVGTTGYVTIEKWTVADALFMTVMILSTVGLEAPHPLSPGGRMFTVALVVTGVSVGAYILAALGEYITGGVLTGMFRERRLAHTIRQLSGHYIVCGFGRVGRQIAADLRSRGCEVVVIESSGAATNGASEEPMAIVGDATDDAVLLHAGIARARGLVAATGSDATNLVIVLSARALNNQLSIVARASDESAVAKLTRAGAAYVISPYAIGGHRIVAELLSPSVTAFLDSLLHTDEVDVWLEVATIAPGSDLVGRTVGDATSSARRPVNLVAMRRAAENDFVTNPSVDARLESGDTLVATGPRGAIRHLGSRAAGTEARAARPFSRQRKHGPGHGS